MPTSYNDSPISERQLRWSYWYITHAVFLHRVMVGILVTINIFIYAFIGYAGFILLTTDRAYQNLLASMSQPLIDYPAWREAQGARPIQLVSSDGIPTTDSQVDVIVRLRNDNTQFVAEVVTVSLVGPNGVVAEQRVRIYPQQENYAFFFNQPGTVLNLSPRIASTQWQRVHDFQDFATPRLNFDFQDISLKPISEGVTQGKLPINSLTFTVVNNTAYSYWRAGFIIALVLNGQVVGGNYVAVDQLKAGEARPIDIRWYQTVPATYDIRIIPDIDILSASAYMPVQ